VSCRLPLHGCTLPSSSPTLLHLLLLAPGDPQGLVLWSTPLLTGMPSAVASELQRLYATMLSAQANQAGCSASPSSAPLDHHQVFNQLFVPFVMELSLICLPGSLQRPEAAAPAPAAGPAARDGGLQLAAHLAGFLQQNRLQCTLEWLLAGAAVLLPAEEHREAAPQECTETCESEVTLLEVTWCWSLVVRVCTHLVGVVLVARTCAVDNHDSSSGEQQHAGGVARGRRQSCSSRDSEQGFEHCTEQG
jgi:hypothetical protein